MQAASVAGIEFSSATIAAVVELDVTEVEECCDMLVRQQHFLQAARESYWPDGTQSASYRFRHALYQELWHERVPVSQRQQFHLRIGQWLERVYGERTDEILVPLANHFERGRAYEHAVHYLQRAAVNALRHSAYREAVTHLHKGIMLLRRLPETQERLQYELTLQTRLGRPLIATKGYGAPEAEAAYTRAFELCRQLGESPKLFSVLSGRHAFYAMRGQFPTAHALAEQCLALAHRLEDPGRLLLAHWTLAQTLFHMGDFRPAREYAAYVTSHYSPRDHQPYTLQDPGVTTLCYLAWSLWQLGSPDQALETSEKALTLARDLSHHFSLAFALIFAAAVHLLRGEQEDSQAHAEEAITLCAEQEFPVWLAFGKILHGQALARQGHEAEGVTQMEEGLTAWKATGAEASLPLVLALLADNQGRRGKPDLGGQLLDEALTVAHKNGELYYEAELYRLRGEIILAQSSVQSLGSRIQGNQKPKIKKKSIDLLRRAGA
jgi:predicted ATPase